MEREAPGGRGVKRTIAQLDHAVQPLSDAERAELRSLGAHFRDVWQSPSCPPELKKKIVRTVVEEIVVSEQPAGTLRFVMHWKGGVHTGFEMPRPPTFGMSPMTFSRRSRKTMGGSRRGAAGRLPSQVT